MNTDVMQSGKSGSKSVSLILLDKYGTQASPGAKIECPFCQHSTFSIKRDDTIGKCFHPKCGRFISLSYRASDMTNDLSSVLEHIFADCHKELMRLSELNGPNSHSYLVKERQIHPQVIADSMIGAVPSGYSINRAFNEIVEQLGNQIQELENASEGESRDRSVGELKERLQLLEEAKIKLDRCLAGASGWLCFFYTDAHRRIVSIRFRKPYSKTIRYFKPYPHISGLFGHGLFRPSPLGQAGEFDDLLIVTEGEFNQLQLQSLALRIAETEGNESTYVNACAVGGVGNADYDTISRVTKHPVICYDNDASQAGLALVKKAQETMHVTAFTTPEPDSDLDEFICSYGARYQEAWVALQKLISNRRLYEKNIDSIRQELKDLRYGKKRAFHVNTDVANAIIGDLRERGRFYNDGLRSYIFLNARKELIPVDRDETEFTLLLDEYGINRADNLAKWILEALGVEGIKNGITTEIRRFSYYDNQNHVVYVTNFANQIYRITVEAIDLVDNGTDGVLFLKDTEAEPFTVGDPAKRESLLDKHLVSRINLSSDRLSPDQRRLLFLLWVLSLFFPSAMRTRAILVFIGEKNSGKSTSCRLLGKILFGSKFDVTAMPSSEQDFDTAATNTAYLVIDNADTKRDWFLDKLALVATGGSTKKRQLYTDNKLVNFPLKCYMSITTRTPQFRRDDLASRFLFMKVNKLDNQIIGESDLTDETLSLRDQLMTEILYLVQDALKALKAKAGLKLTTSFRMADFATFAIRIAAFGGIRDEVESILRLASAEQSDFTIEDDPVVDLLERWARKNPDMEIRATDLCVELAKLAEEENMGFFYKGKERSFAQKLPHMISDLSERMEITCGTGHAGAKLYKIRLRERSEPC